MKRKSVHLNQKGFTLIELLAMMVIIGVMASVGVKKLDVLSDTATNRVFQEGVKELNIRESLTWANIKLSPAGWTDDAQLFSDMDAAWAHIMYGQQERMHLAAR